MLNDVTTTTYIAHQLPGIFFPEESIEKIDSRDPQRHANEAPKNAFTFFYFDIVTTIVMIGDESIEVESGRINTSKMYYLDAEVVTLDQLKNLPPDSHRDSMIFNMTSYGHDSMIRCRTGNYQPFQADKHVLLKTR